MKKPILLLFTVLFLLSGCGQAVSPTPAQAPTQPEASVEPTATVPPTEELVLVPTETSTPLAVTLPPPALPVCSPEQSITGCEVPAVQELDRFCAKEKPYTLYAVPQGVTIESVTPNFSCNDEGVRRGNQQYSCTGLPSYTFRARLCNTACVAPVEQESEQCPRGYGINTASNCCVPVQTTVNGCAEINLQIGVCIN